MGTLKIKQRVLAPNLTGEAIVDQTARDSAASASTAAATAQSTANGAETHAQTGITNAAAAQSTANTALANAATAEADAQQGISDAADALSVASAIKAIVAGPIRIGSFLGNDLNRVVLTLPAGPNNSTVNVAHGVTVVRVLRCDVVMSSGSTNRPFGGGGLASATLTSQIVVSVDTTNVSLTSGVTGNYSGYSGYIILEYTDE